MSNNETSVYMLKVIGARGKNSNYTVTKEDVAAILHSCWLCFQCHQNEKEKMGREKPYLGEREQRIREAGDALYGRKACRR